MVSKVFRHKSKIFVCNLSRAGSILFTGKIVVYSREQRAK